MPKSYCLPDDHKKLQKRMKKNNFRVIYIAKPSAGGCGAGIKLIRKSSEIDPVELLDRKYVV